MAQPSGWLYPGVFAAALVGGAFLTAAARRLAWRMGVLDGGVLGRPDVDRTPLLGGLVIYGGPGAGGRGRDRGGRPRAGSGRRRPRRRRCGRRRALGEAASLSARHRRVDMPSTSSPRPTGAGVVLAAALASALGLGLRLAAPAVADHTDSSQTEDIFAVDLMGPALVRVESSWVRAGNGPTGSSEQPARFTVTCTGVFVNADGHLATAGSCVDQPGATLQGDVMVTIADGVPDHAPVAARVLEARTAEGEDLALLKVPGRNLPAVQLARRVPESARAVVGGFRTTTTSITSAADAYYFNTSVATRPGGGGGAETYEIGRPVLDGMLGAPVSEFGGTVVGLAHATGVEGSRSFTRLTPAPRVLALMASHDVANDIGAAGRAYLAGLRSAIDYDYADAVGPIREALAANPHLQSARTLLETAEALSATEAGDDDGGMPWAVLAAGGSAAVLAVGGALFRRRRRRRTPVSAALAPAVE